MVVRKREPRTPEQRARGTRDRDMVLAENKRLRAELAGMCEKMNLMYGVLDDLWNEWENEGDIQYDLGKELFCRGGAERMGWVESPDNVVYEDVNEDGAGIIVTGRARWSESMRATFRSVYAARGLTGEALEARVEKRMRTSKQLRKI